MTLAEFLLARIAEDETSARRATEGLSMMSATEVQIMGVAVYAPARVLAECEAKRRIVELHREASDFQGGWGMLAGRCATCYEDTFHPRDPIERAAWPCRTLRALALPYADHPEFREEWKP